MTKYSRKLVENMKLQRSLILFVVVAAYKFVKIKKWTRNPLYASTIVILL